MTGAKYLKEITCDVPGCNIPIRRYTKSKHFMAVHPEFKFSTGSRNGGGLKLICDTCGANVSSFGKLVQYHTHNGTTTQNPINSLETLDSFFGNMDKFFDEHRQLLVVG